jgi:dihydroneopterin aldolase
VITERAGTPGQVTGDRLALTGLRARGRHGFLPAERELGQEFVVDVVLGLDTSPAAAQDDLSRTVDYGTLAGRLVSLIEGPPVNLIETLAERLAAVCLDAQHVEEVEVTVHKPNAPIPHAFEDVSVTIHRVRA